MNLHCSDMTVLHPLDHITGMSLVAKIMNQNMGFFTSKEMSVYFIRNISSLYRLLNNTLYKLYFMFKYCFLIPVSL